MTLRTHLFRNLARRLLLGWFLAGAAALGWGQWKTETFALVAGWNSVFLSVDASHTTLTEMLAGRTDIREIWQWVPGDPGGTFRSSPDEPAEEVSEWLVWRQGDPAGSTLAFLTGNAAYLVKVDDLIATTSFAVTGQPRVPFYTWRYNGLNFFGFPVNPASPVFFDAYLAAAPEFSTSEIYRYVGGPLGPANPAKIFKQSTAEVEPGRAYWIDARQYSDFYGPLKVAGLGGLRYGESINLLRFRLENLQATSMVATLRNVASEVAPTGQQPVAGMVPLRRRVFDAESGDFVYEAIPAEGLDVVLPPEGVVELMLSVDRSMMSGDPGDAYQSLLRLTDDGGISQIDVPVSAEAGTLSGLWLGVAVIDQVQNQLQRFAEDADGNRILDSEGRYDLAEDSVDTDLHATDQNFSLRMILHLDETMVGRLLHSAYVGTLASSGERGSATSQDALDPAELASAARVSAAHLPPGTVLVDNRNAGATVPTSLSFDLTVGYNDPTNPFVHAYHPDHDNLDARYENTLPAGVESWNVVRTMDFTFVPDPAELGLSEPGWGATVLGGTYQETLTGLHNEPITTQGIFILRRVFDAPGLE